VATSGLALAEDARRPATLPVWELDVLTRELGCRLGAELALCFASDGGRVTDVLCAWGVDGSEGPQALAGERVLLQRMLVTGAGGGAVDCLDRRHKRTRAATGRRVTHGVGAPVHTPDGVAGTLYAGFALAPNDPRLALWTAESYARLAGLCLHDPGVLGGLLASVQRDGLTGCLNYASVREALATEIERAARHGLRMSCAFIDLDDFKLVNDRHGHIHGNQILAAVAGELRRGVRDADIIGRYGGDEFVAILPETTQAGALRLARRLRAQIHTATLAFDDEPVEVSIGVAEWTPGSASEHVLEQADRALLRAKHGGGGIAASGFGSRA
jgi:diguanylate cyclase (GGDEF)-like protein